MKRVLILMAFVVAACYSQSTEGKAPGTCASPPGTFPIDATPPDLVFKVEPKYTEAARRDGIKGIVTLCIVIGEDGLPLDVKVLEGLGRGLDESAIEAALQWKFKPAMKDGIAVTVRCKWRVTFSPKSPSCPIAITSLESSSDLKAGLFAFLVSAGSSNSYLILKYRNNSPKHVSGVRFAVVYFNSVGEPSYTEDVTTPTQNLRPGKTSGLVQADDQITGGAKVALTGWVAKVRFSDGTTWTDDGSKSCPSR